MATQNMATITASLERSFENFSLNHKSNTNSGDEVSNGIGLGRSVSTFSSPDDRQDHNNLPNNDTTLELNSHVSLPYYWEQCLDLKTGEIYYINWRNGMKAKEDPRTIQDQYNGDYYSEDDDDDDDDDSFYDSEESSSSPERSREQQNKGVDKDNVLVVGGCKSCLMYFMVPKLVHDCPKCNGQLLHFDRSGNCSLST